MVKREPLALLAARHLTLRLRPLLQALRLAVERRHRLESRINALGTSNLCLSREQTLGLIDLIDQHDDIPEEEPRRELTPAEREEETLLREQSATLGFRLPLDAFETELELTPTEVEVLLLCAAPEIDPKYERIFGFVVDDLNRRFPSVELLAEVIAERPDQRLPLIRELGPLGRLRRIGILRHNGDAATGLHQELRLEDSALHFLLGGHGPVASSFRDPQEVPLACVAEAASHNPRVDALASAFAGGTVVVVGVWGPPHSDRHRSLLQIATRRGRPLRRLALDPQASIQSQVVHSIRTCATLDATLWVDLDALTASNRDQAESALEKELSETPVPTLLEAAAPCRLLSILASSRYAEVSLEPPSHSQRRHLWSNALEPFGEIDWPGLASHYRLGSSQIEAAVGMARAESKLNGSRSAPLADVLRRSVRAIAWRGSGRFGRIIETSRPPSDLVLEPELERQVLQIPDFYRAWSKIAEQREGHSPVLRNPGMKVLFTGDSGTGKTLTAEILGGTLGLPLLKIDLAQVVSKWVGETEKNLSTVFDEARASDVVLFFDEADVLFGKRGEVQRGTDRYANLEVGYLLQRLEEFDGLVVLASNLRENIDEAFTRRFHICLHFPRPGRAERLRIWQLCLNQAAELPYELDLDALSGLDMTGGSIAGAARTALLLSAAEDSDRGPGMDHLIEGIARQFKQESRVFDPGQLGLRSDPARSH